MRRRLLVVPVIVLALAAIGLTARQVLLKRRVAAVPTAPAQPLSDRS